MRKQLVAFLCAVALSVQAGPPAGAADSGSVEETAFLFPPAERNDWDVGGDVLDLGSFDLPAGSSQGGAGGWYVADLDMKVKFPEDGEGIMQLSLFVDEYAAAQVKFDLDASSATGRAHWTTSDMLQGVVNNVGSSLEADVVMSNVLQNKSIGEGRHTVTLRGQSIRGATLSNVQMTGGGIFRTSDGPYDVTAEASSVERRVSVGDSIVLKVAIRDGSRAPSEVRLVPLVNRGVAGGEPIRLLTSDSRGPVTQGRLHFEAREPGRHLVRVLVQSASRRDRVLPLGYLVVEERADAPWLAISVGAGSAAVAALCGVALARGRRSEEAECS